MFQSLLSDPDLMVGSLMLAIAFAAVLQDDLTCICAGVGISCGDLPLWPTLLACFAGTLLGDLAWMLAGRIAGLVAISRWPFSRLLSRPQLEQGRNCYRRYGAAAVFISRFVPGVRTPTQFMAGILTENLLQTVAVFSLAAAVYTPFVVFGALFVGGSFDLQAFYHSYGVLVMIAAAALLWGALHVGRGALRLNSM